MAKDLPYFKFFCSEWTDGDITLEDYDVQGVFINLCSYYWSRECKLELTKAYKRFKGYESIIETLLENNLIKNLNGNLKIKFLDEQKKEREKKGSTSRENGKLGGRPSKAKITQDKPNRLILGTQTITKTEPNQEPNETQLREEKKREEKRREKELKEKLENAFEIFWTDYPKKINKDNAQKTLTKFIKSGVTIEAICEAMNKSEALRADYQYIPNPQAWLNKTPWLDEAFKPMEGNEQQLSLAERMEKRR